MVKGINYAIKFKDSKYVAKRNEKDELEIYEVQE